jgi:iron-sulfur cluster assembly protein
MISLTDRAYTKVKRLLQAKDYAGIRLGVKTTGCSGLAYVLEYVDETWEGSTSFPQDGFSIVIDTRDLAIVENIEIDYVRRGLNEGFEFNNPLERDRCGCGESFRI